jgi:ribulose-bisphosphate carboxylase large chain
MVARGEYILQTFGPDADKVAFLVDGYVGGPGMVTTARRHFPNQYLHYHRAGHGAVTSPSAKRGYTAYVLAKMSRLQGASGIHVGTMGYGKMEGDKDDRAIAYIIERDSYTGPAYHQEWYGMKPTTPIISGGMNALRLPGFFENLGHGNVINTAGGGAYGHIDSPAAGAKIAASGLRMLAGQGRSDRMGQGAPGVCPRLRFLPQGCRPDLPRLARKAGRP